MFSFCVTPSSSHWIRSSAIIERNICTSSTDNETAIFWMFKKKCVLVQNSCVWSFAGCADLNLAGLLCLMSQVQWCRQWRLSPANQWSLYTSRFGNDTVRLEPQPRWYWKKYQELYPVTPPQKKWNVQHCTLQWKSAIRQFKMHDFNMIYMIIKTKHMFFAEYLRNEL